MGLYHFYSFATSGKFNLGAFFQFRVIINEYYFSPDDRSLTKVYFKSDAAFMIINALFSLSNGYVANICMMATPKMVKDPSSQGIAASYLVFSLVGGLLAGSATSRL